LKKITIALVEDNLTDISNLIGIFEKSNLIEVKHTFLNGIDFLNFIEKQTIKVDAVVIDYRMPILDGLKTFRNLMFKQPDFKILLVSHGYYSYVMKEVMSMGNQNYIQKNGDLILQVLPRLIAGQAIYDDPTSIFNWDIQTKKNDLTVKDKSEVEKLKPLQKKIIRLLAIGLCSNEIGNVLNYETSSIEKYRGNILKEYDLKNSFQLSSWAFSNELVTTSFIFQASQKVVDENSLQPDELSLLMTLKKHLNTKKNL